MGFEMFGMRVFDLSRPFGYFEAFSTIAVVSIGAFVVFLLLRRLKH